MRLIFVVAYPNDKFCGVGDYTEKLASAIKAQGQDVFIENIERWSFKSLLDLRNKYRNDKNIIFHVQYPSMGLGKSIAPAFLPFVLNFSPVYLTLHEFSVFNFLRKIIFSSYAFFAKSIIFSSVWERGQFRKFFKREPSREHVIPIGSNIQPADGVKRVHHSKLKIIYFGQIVENKGIEEVMQAIGILRSQNKDFDAAIMGAMLDVNGSMVQELQDFCQTYDVELLAGLSEADVSKQLLNADVAILPFPDGISEKRGSALACLEHGLQIVTRHTEKTPQWLKRATINADTPQNIAEEIVKLIDMPSRESTTFMEEIENLKWPNIAQKHLSLYKAQE